MIPAILRPATRWGRLLLAAGSLAAAAGCATTGSDSRDPFESFNRSMYGFNQKLDEVVLKPVSTAYKEGLPELVQTGVRNFFANIADIFISVNNLLQGKVIDAASDGMRFALNTTIGGLGVLDWASEMGLEKHNEDFGQTFGRWGAGNGPYFVWPLLGSSTARDSIGGILNIAVDPVANHKPAVVRNVMSVTRVIGKRADLLDASRLLEEAALDKYVFERDAYLQRRRNLIYDGNPPRESARMSPAADPVRASEHLPNAGPVADGRATAADPPKVEPGEEPREQAGNEAVLSASIRRD